jgi:superfamily II helicase
MIATMEGGDPWARKERDPSVSEAGLVEVTDVHDMREDDGGRRSDGVDLIARARVDGLKVRA